MSGLERKDKRAGRQDSRYAVCTPYSASASSCISYPTSPSTHICLPRPTSPNSSAYGAVVYPASSLPPLSPFPVPARSRGPHPYLSPPTLRPFPTRDPSWSDPGAWAHSVSYAQQGPRASSSISHKPQISPSRSDIHPVNCYLTSQLLSQSGPALEVTKTQFLQALMG